MIEIAQLQDADLEILRGLWGLSETPEQGIAIVARDGDRIVGYWLVQSMLVAEPVWIEPERRGGVIGFRMFAELLKLIQELGAEGFYVHTDDDKIASYLTRLGLTNTGWTAFFADMRRDAGE